MCRQSGGGAQKIELLVCRLGLIIYTPQVGQKFSLGRREFDLRLLSAKQTLLYPAVSRAPVPHRDVQRGSSGVTQIADTIGVDRKMSSIDNVEVIKCHTRQIAGTSSGQFCL